MMPLPNEVLALIPARSGSKGIPGKNTRDFCGAPLIHWTIRAARESGVAARVIVSTDGETIAEIARAGGAEVPFLRPPEWARDDSPMIDVALGTLDLLAARESWEPAWLLLLQPTSPLRTAEDIQRAAALLAASDADAVVSVAPAKHHPQWLQQLSPEGRLLPCAGTPSARRQDLPPVYALNGAIYLTRTATLRASRTFFPTTALGYVMSAERSVDIDTEMDWKLAELFAAPR